MFPSLTTQPFITTTQILYERPEESDSDDTIVQEFNPLFTNNRN